MAFPWRKKPFRFEARLLLPLACEALLGDLPFQTSASYLVLRKLESESEVTSWYPVGHIWSAGISISLWLAGHRLQASSLPSPLLVPLEIYLALLSRSQGAPGKQIR